MRIAPEPPRQPDVLALIDALDAYQRLLYPPESHHGIDIEALSRPDVLFAVARDDAGRAVCCGAVVIEAPYGELKRMYVEPALRGTGVARGLLEFSSARCAAADVPRCGSRPACCNTTRSRCTNAPASYAAVRSATTSTIR